MLVVVLAPPLAAVPLTALVPPSVEAPPVPPPPEPPLANVCPPTWEVADNVAEWPPVPVAAPPTGSVPASATIKLVV